MPKVTDKEWWNENLSLAAWFCTVGRKKNDPRLVKLYCWLSSDLSLVTRFYLGLEAYLVNIFVIFYFF